MSIARVAVLLGKEFRQGWRNVIFIFAVVVPVILTLVVSLLFGTIFSGKARLGLVDLGSSQLVGRATALSSLDVKTYPSPDALRAATAAGRADLGIVLPAGFDARIAGGEKVALTAYLWGESALKNRAVAATVFTSLLRDIAGQAAPVEIVTTTLGDGASIPWETRLLPLLVIMAIILGGSLVPAGLLIDEKQKRTLRALTTSPASLAEVFVAKGLLGVILSVVMTLVTLFLNRAWGPEPVLLAVALILGAIMAACIGLLMGAFVRDINTLLTVVKGGGLLLYAPAIVYMIPEIPQWIGRIFPTYYMIQPVIEVVQQNGDFASVLPELVVLVVLDLVLVAILALVVRRAPQGEGALNPA